MENNRNWPGKRQSLYNMPGDGIKSPTWCFLDWINDDRFNANRMASEFKRAADKIVLMLAIDDDQFHRDGLFMPVAYLYRHSLELKLKYLLELVVLCDLIPPENIKPVITGHDLVELWDLCKSAIQKHWPNNEKSALNNTEALIRDFHKIDKSGQGLRYSHDTHGNKTISRYPKTIDLGLFQQAFDGIYNLLDGCCMEFSSLSEYIQEYNNSTESRYDF